MKRAFGIERGHIDRETGQFSAVVATNGEASDTHILDIETLQVSATLPMFTNHIPDPVNQLGSFSNARIAGNVKKKGRASLRMDGRIDVTQDGALGDIRRDVVHRIFLGDITSVSAHWTGGEGAEEIPRASLKVGHWAHDDTPGGWRGTPKFLRNQRLMENSIVGVGSDQGALIGRSQDLSAPEHVREFYRGMVKCEAAELREWANGSMPLITQQLVGEDWVRIKAAEGHIYMPRDVAAVWGQSVDETVKPALDPQTCPECLREGVRGMAHEDCRSGLIALRHDSREEVPSTEQPERDAPSGPSPQSVQTIRDVMREVMGESSTPSDGEELREILRREMGIVF